MELHTLGTEVLPQRVPQCGVEIRFGDVENQSLAGTQEVDVEHRRQFSGREPVGAREEAPREDFERKMASGDGKVDIGQESVRVAVVEPFVDAGHRDSGQRRGRGGVDPDQIPESESRAAQGENQRIPRRRLRQAAEGVPPALPVDERIVLYRAQALQSRVAALQQRAQVVVLPEKGMEATVVGAHGAVIEVLSPPGNSPTEVGLALQYVHRDSAFG